MHASTCSAHSLPVSRPTWKTNKEEDCLQARTLVSRSLTYFRYPSLWRSSGVPWPQGYLRGGPDSWDQSLGILCMWMTHLHCRGGKPLILRQREQAERWQEIELKSKHGPEHMPFIKMSTKISMSVWECLLDLKWKKFYRFSWLLLGRKIPLRFFFFLEDSLTLLRNAPLLVMSPAPVAWIRSTSFTILSLYASCRVLLQHHGMMGACRVQSRWPISWIKWPKKAKVGYQVFSKGLLN